MPQKFMKVVLLEHPRGRSALHFNTVANTPLSSALISGYLASTLRSHGIQTELYEAVFVEDDFTATVDAVAGMPWGFMGVHLVYSWERTPAVFAMLEEIAARTDVPIMAYGFYPTCVAEYLVRTCPFIGGVIRGEPEQTFLEVCCCAGGGYDLSRIKGLTWRWGNECVVNPRREVIHDLDALPFPHRTRGGLARSGGTILGSRGCYGSCSFCCINN